MSDSGAVKAAIQLREVQARMCEAGHEPSCLALGLVRTPAPVPWVGAAVAGSVAGCALGFVAWVALR